MNSQSYSKKEQKVVRNYLDNLYFTNFPSCQQVKNQLKSSLRPFLHVIYMTLLAHVRIQSEFAMTVTNVEWDFVTLPMFPMFKLRQSWLPMGFWVIGFFWDFGYEILLVFCQPWTEIYAKSMQSRKKLCVLEVMCVDKAKIQIYWEGRKSDSLVGSFNIFEG